MACSEHAIQLLHVKKSSSTAVVVPVTRRSTIGHRAFPVPADRAWNSFFYRRLSHRRHCRLSNDIWRRTFCDLVLMALLTLLFLSLSIEHVVFLCVLRVLAVFGLNATLIFSLIIIIIIIMIIIINNKCIWRNNRPICKIAWAHKTDQVLAGRVRCRPWPRCCSSCCCWSRSESTTDDTEDGEVMRSAGVRSRWGWTGEHQWRRS